MVNVALVTADQVTVTVRAVLGLVQVAVTPLGAGSARACAWPVRVVAPTVQELAACAATAGHRARQPSATDATIPQRDRRIGRLVLRLPSIASQRLPLLRRPAVGRGAGGRGRRS